MSGCLDLKGILEQAKVLEYYCNLHHLRELDSERSPLYVWVRGPNPLVRTGARAHGPRSCSLQGLHFDWPIFIGVRRRVGTACNLLFLSLALLATQVSLLSPDAPAS